MVENMTFSETDVQVRYFTSGIEADVIRVINAYTAGWLYSRPVDGTLLAYWKQLGENYQPGQMFLVYRQGSPWVFLHGERQAGQHFIHLLAVMPGEAELGAWALQQVEAQARADGVKRLCGPTCSSNVFYGGYILGREPYHPHWAAEATRSFVRAGFRITQAEVLMVRDMSSPVQLLPAPAGYDIVEAPAPAEYTARTIRYVADYRGDEAAICSARVYPALVSPQGKVLGQIGHVETHPDHRGRGLAKILVQLCLLRLGEWGAGEVILSTGLENPAALSVYEHVGFKRWEHQNEWSRDL